MTAGGEVQGVWRRARREALDLSNIPDRSAWRDRRLMALVAHKRGQPKG